MTLATSITEYTEFSNKLILFLLKYTKHNSNENIIEQIGNIAPVILLHPL